MIIHKRGRQLDIPNYIAICGYPLVGKSTIAEILRDDYGANIVDDGLVLRKACMELYSLTWADVSTQEGKAREVEICGQKFTVRQLLGDLGKLMEAKHGSQFMPDRAIASIGNSVAPFHVFPSCRMNQGITYLKNNGVVLEVVRKNCFPNYDFDNYDQSLVTTTIHNDMGLNDLRSSVWDFMCDFDIDKEH